MIVNLNQAIADGYTPSSLRAIANSLERIARQGYYHVVHQEVADPDGGFDYHREFTVHEPAYDPVSCRANARSLRSLAKAMANA